MSRKNIKKEFILTFIGVYISCIMVSPVHSVEWNYIASFEPTGEDYYVDLQSIKVEDSAITFWVKRMVKEQKIYYMDKVTINCKENIFTVKQCIEATADGTAATKFIAEGQNLEWSVIPADSFIHIFQELLCIDGQPNPTVIDPLRATK